MHGRLWSAEAGVRKPGQEKLHWSRTQVESTHEKEASRQRERTEHLYEWLHKRRGEKAGLKVEHRPERKEGIGICAHVCGRKSCIGDRLRVPFGKLGKSERKIYWQGKWYLRELGRECVRV